MPGITVARSWRLGELGNKGMSKPRMENDIERRKGIIAIFLLG